MSFERLEAAVIAEAKAEAAKIVESARAEAGALLARARADQERAFEDAVRQAETAQTRETARQTGLAGHEGRLAVLEAKNRLIDEVFGKAKERIRTLPDAEYMALMADWLKALPDDAGGTVMVNPSDEKRFTKAFLDGVNASRPAGGKYSGVATDARISGGFLVAGESFTIDATLDNRMSDLRESLAGDIARELFGS